MAKKFRKAKPGAVCVMDAEGNIGSRRRRRAVGWTRGPDGAPPERVTVQTVPGR